ncbi:MAG: DUF2225 domain-containing protein [Spirochaetia bacterium]
MSERGSTLTFFSKEPIECPVCTGNFYREELRTGRGRLIAGDLTHELRRIYVPSKKYGEVFPLNYPVTVCPNCYYSAYHRDFLELPEKSKAEISEDTTRRMDSIQSIFPVLDFTDSRGLEEGCAGYFFALMCYDFFPPEFSPTIKQGLSALRAAWLCNDLHRKKPNENYDYLSKIFYRKARFFYNLAVEHEQKGAEGIAGAKHLGPDLDKDYGYDGVLYMAGYLEYKYGPKGDTQKRKAALDRAKRTIAKIFGMGRASKDKPVVLLDNARDVYEEIAKEMGIEIPEEIG